MLRVKQKRRCPMNKRKKRPNYTSGFREDVVRLVVDTVIPVMK